jgi:hypothetical protein
MPIDPRRTALALLLAIIGTAPFAWADAPPKKKKKGKPKHHAPTAAPTATTPEIELDEPPPPVAPPPPPDAVAPPPPPPAVPEASPPSEQSIYLGVRYRGNVIPQALVNVFADQAGTFYSNQIGIEADLRTRDFSLIPALTYVTYGTGGPVLFLQKGQDPLTAANWTEVNSSMKAIFATVDVMWSKRLAQSLDFEYGAGIGVGVVFGGLVDNWVYPDGAAGPLKSNVGYPSFAPCQTASDTLPNGQSVNGCSSFDHNGKPPQVGGFQEPSWFGGGAKPVFFPWVGIPQIGLRYKPIGQVETRLTVGLALTGFWFGLSADYGLEKREKN